MSTKASSMYTYELTNDGARLVLDRREYGFHIWGLETDPKLVRRGYARKLTQRVIKFANKRNIHITLNVGKFRSYGASNDVLHQFYLSLGFKGEPHFMRYKPC